MVWLGDGYLARCSFSQLARGVARDQVGQLSDIPLDGRISSMHIARDERSGENLVVGGGDDGSVAIWSLRSVSRVLCSPHEHG